MGEILDNFIFALTKIGSAEEKRASDTANLFLKSYIDYFQHTSESIKSETTQWGMYALQLNRERLDKKALTMQVNLKNSKREVDSVLAGKDGKYTIYEVHRLAKKKLSFLHNNKKIKHYQKDCEIILDVIETIHSQNEYSCPCCGNMDVIENFFDGCKYCGTKFNFEDFQSKVNQVHFRDTAMVTFHGMTYALLYIKQLSLCCGGLGVLSYHLIRIILPYLGKVPPSDAYNLFLGTLGAFIYGTFLGGLIIFAGSILLSLIWAIIVNPIVTAKYNNDMWKNNQLAAKIRKKDVAFSAESFATILNSRMQALHFADNKAEIEAFIKCNVKDVLPQYKNIVYLNMDRYRMKKCWMDEHFQYISADLMLQCFLFNGKKMKQVKEKVRVRLKRKASAVTQVLNEKVYLSCPDCGASLSLRNGCKCQYCNCQPDLADIDWVIDQYNIL
ncbi:MAG: hypothetical protein ACI4GW_05125 [Lachnospiraceae bacterium]